MAGKGSIILLLLSVLITSHIAADSNSDMLLDAAFRGDLEAVQTALARGADIEARDDSYDWTALMWAATGAHVDVVEHLISRGANVNARTGEYAAGTTALILSAYWGDAETVEVLLENGGRLNDTDSDGWTALTNAAWRGQIAIVRLLLEHNTEPEDRGNALISAVDNGHVTVGRLLMDTRISQEDRNNALLIAAKKGYADYIPLLLQQGANPNSIGEKDRTVLLHACMAGDLNVDVFQSLVQAGADVDAQDYLGMSALMAVAERGSIEVAEYLVSVGAELDAINYKEKTALMYAVGNGYLGITRILLEAGADVSAADQDGQTALRTAMGKGFTEIEALLKRHGATR